MPAYAVKCVCSIGGREKKTNMSVSHTDAIKCIFLFSFWGWGYIMFYLFSVGGGCMKTFYFLYSDFFLKIPVTSSLAFWICQNCHYLPISKKWKTSYLIFKVEIRNLIKSFSLSGPDFYILNKSENATPELFATYIQNYANQECNWKCNLIFKYWVIQNSKSFTDVVMTKHMKAI